MTIQQKLHDHYEKVIAVAKKKKYADLGQYLMDEDCWCGLCYCALQRFKEDIYGADWVKKISYNPYWYAAPNELFNKKDIMQSLQYRLTILKTLI